MAVGLLAGFIAAVIATCVCLYLKHKKKMAGHNESAKTYTAYGEGGGGVEIGGGGA